MKKFFSTPLLVVIASIFVSGCSTLNIGESEFACPATKVDGLKCMGVRDLYKATDGPLSSIGKKSVSREAGAGEKVKLQAADASAGYEPTPWMDKPTPIRSQAKVMRIWVAPFEDEVGDLNAPGMVFTEIEPRRWNVGEGLVKRPARLTPVQVGGGGGGAGDAGAPAATNPFGVTNSSGQAIKSLKNIPVANPDQKGGVGGQKQQRQQQNQMMQPGMPGQGNY